jgi:hypothetical protein
MRSIQNVVVGTMLAVVSAGCGGGTSEGVGALMPNAPVTMPPELEQMKKELEKNRPNYVTRPNRPSGYRKG